jgi:hypothetical protein
LKKWIKSKWTDPVWSKVFSNIIWTALTALASLIALLLYKLYSKISFRDTYNNVVSYLNENRLISNKTILLAVIIFLFVSLNRISVLRLLKYLLLAFRGPYHSRKVDYQFNNWKSKETGEFKEIYTGMSFNKLFIKPSNESLQWSFYIYISHTHKEKDEKQIDETLCLQIVKSIENNSLLIRDFKKNSEVVLLHDYYAQSFVVDFNSTKGGIIILIYRNDETLFQSDLYFGYNKIIYSASGSGHDFNINVTYEHIG